MDFDDLLTLVKRGIPEIRAPYLGAPGKEVFYALQDLSDGQLKELSVRFVNAFPKIPVSPSVHLSAFFGMFTCYI